ncbi:DUF1416 domain-containing protein [Myxococcota bacterium]|nr:DUF1416 domain-containing protein [Myxococcota bacterium]
MQQRAVIIIGLALAGLLSCDEGDEPVAPQGRAGCRARGDCPQGLSCVEGVCVGGEAPTWRLALRLLPNTDSAYGPADVLDFQFDGALALRVPHLTLWEWASREGRVATLEGNTVAAQMTARGTSGIDTPPLSFSANPITTGERLFRVNLMSWWPTARDDRRPPRYAVRLEPEGLPPYTLSGWIVPSTDDVLFELPSTASLARVSGEVLLSENNPLPQRGLSVTILDAEGRRLATTAETDDLGRFEVRLWPGISGQGILRVRATDPDRPLPQLEQAIDLQRAQAAPQVLYMGQFESLFELQGAVLAEGTPIGGAQVRLRGKIGAGRFEANADTGAEGGFTAKVYPGEYTIDIIPPPPHRLTRIKETLSPAAPLYLAPQLKTPVFAHVVDFSGQEIAEARIIAELIRPYWTDPQLEDDAPPPLRRVETQSDAEGAFTLQLDPGAHEITISPASGAGLPEARFSLQVPGRQPVSHVRFEIPPAVVVTLRLLSPDGAPLSDVIAEAWQQGEAPLRVGQGITDTNGEVILALPNFPSYVQK